MSSTIFNANPTIFAPAQQPSSSSRDAGRSLWIADSDESEPGSDTDDGAVEAIDRDEIFDLIRGIYDPEHPNTLEELHVVSAAQISVHSSSSSTSPTTSPTTSPNPNPNSTSTSTSLVTVEFTPTVPHCGMSTLIGLSIRVRLMRSLPTRYKVDIVVKPGSHQSELAVNKQLNDKERVAAALENSALVDTLEQTLAGVGRRV